MYCHNCGNHLDDDMQYCPYCGAHQEERPWLTQEPEKPSKKKRNKGLPFAIGLFAAFLIAVPVWFIFGKEKPQNNISYDSDGLPYYNDVLVVYAYEDLTDARRLELADMVSGKIEDSDLWSGNLLKINVSQTDLDQLEAYAELLTANEDIIYASYDYPVSYEVSTDNNTWRARGDGTEPDLGQTDTPRGNDWWAEAVDAYTVWDNYTDLISDPVTVGIIDSGFSTDHEEMQGKITVLGNNTYNGHGTFVSGLICANNNDVGIRGIADRSPLLAYSHIGENASTYSDMSALVISLVKNDAKVINCSFNISYNIDAAISEGKTREQYDAERDAETARDAKSALSLMAVLYETEPDKDYIIVQAAGNGENSIGPGVDTRFGGWMCGINENIYNDWKTHNKIFSDIPYDYFDSHTIVVGAASDERLDDGNYKMAYFSNYGNNVDICAPGVNIYSICDEDGQKYGTDKGTSFAAPIVTGTAAVMWSLNPDLTAGEVKEILKETAAYSVIDEDDPDKPTGYPMLNAGAAAKEAYERRDPSSKESTDTPSQSKNETSESTEAASLKDYLRSTLVPQYGVMPTDLLDSGNLADYAGWNPSELTGMLSATIKDFDHDGYDEMLITRFDTNADGKTDLILQMYEYAADTNTVSLCAETRLATTNGYAGNGIIGYRQTGIFSYEYNGSTYIAIDHNMLANASVSSLAVFTYIGVNSEYTQPGAQKPEFGTGTPTQFAYYGGAGYQQQGSGLWFVFEGLPAYEGRRTIEPENPLFCAQQTSEWHELCKYDPDNQGSVSLISAEQSQQFMDAYYAKVTDLGLNADDVRLSIDPIELTQDKYKTEHTLTPQIYTAVEGEIDWISGIYTYSRNYPSEPHELLREDNQHTLDEFR